jgi:hypothetical protein
LFGSLRFASLELLPIYSFHLAKTDLITTLRNLWWPPSRKRVPGLRHSECMTRMQLGAPILSFERAQFGSFVMFASWDSEEALEDFLRGTPLGRKLTDGWHVRLSFLRRWGQVSEFKDLPLVAEVHDTSAPVVAVTLARMRLLQVPRFIRWGRPVEALVRDHPGKTLALAAVRLPSTVSTFSVWRSAQEMTDMVQGHSAVQRPERHSAAMAERNRKDFHFEFTTLRFRTLSEHGEWEGQRNIVPLLGESRPSE